MIDAIRPLALADKQDNLLHQAWRAANITSDAPAQRVAGLQEAVRWLDKAQAAHAEVVVEDKRMTAACEAFRKLLAKA